MCASYISAVMEAVPLNPLYDCLCTSDPLTGLVASNCASTPPSVFIYSHSAGAAASALPRRRNELALDESYCPIGQDACQISSDPALGYECLATSTELGE